MKSGWRTLPFTDAVSDQSGGNPKTPQSDLLPTGRFAVVDQGKELVAGYVDDSSRLCRVELPAIVFGDHTRCFKFVDFDFCMGADGTKVLRPKIEADVKYLYYYLRQLRLTDGGYDRHFKYLKRSEILLPPLSEQRRIAEVLDRAEALRAKRRAAIAQLEQLSRAIFFDLFGDPTTNPKRMRKAPLGDLIKLKSGEFLPATAMVTTGEFPVFGGNGVNGHHDQFLYDDTRIVIGRVGAYCGCVHVCPPRSWVTDNAMCVSERKADVELEYLAYSLKLANLNQYASQSGQPLVSGSRIYPVEILVPPLALQQDFACRIAAVEKLKAAHRASLVELDALFASLQHRAFRGEL